MENTGHTIRFKPHVSPRDFADLCIGLFLVLPLQLLGLLVLPGTLIFFVTSSWWLVTAGLVIIGAVFYCFTVSSVTLSPDGMRFHRLIGTPKFLPWSAVRSLEVAPRWELIVKGWLWPLLPAREMTTSMTSLHHFRISWDGGFCYFPPADAEAFEKYAANYLPGYQPK
jgi:hypothetical protein